MRRLMGKIPQALIQEFGGYTERYQEMTHRYRETGGYDETSSNTEGQVAEFRQADFPLPLGESVMINHARYGNLLQTGTTPITDDCFHHDVLS
jgi:hypothetical protein